MRKNLPVEVRSRFDGRWVAGFDVAAVRGGQVWLRRHSDGMRLPEPFPVGDVREHPASGARPN